jgi:flagellar protein FlaC
MLKFRLRKKEEEEKEKFEEEELEEEVKEEETKKENVESDTLTKVMERLNEVENRLPRIDVAIDGIKRELDEIKSQLREVDDTLKDVMVLYEVVSAQINPFMSTSGIIDIGELKRRLEILEKDLIIIINLNINKIIEDELYGG